MSAINPRLIYCSISAFGHDGPRGKQTAYDYVIQATSGLMAMTGTDEVNPIKFGAPAVDYATGTMARLRDSPAPSSSASAPGSGQRIDLAMFDVAMILMSSHLTGYLRNGAEPKPVGQQATPRDEQLLSDQGRAGHAGASNLRQQRRLWQALERPEWPRTTTRRAKHDRDREAALLAES